jgi:hypothetical protein
MTTKIPRVVPVAGLLIGFPALLRGLLLLDRDPFVAVLGLLAAMAVLFASLACFCGHDALESVSSLDDRNKFLNSHEGD